jgi:hypothetical protein
MLAVGGFGWAIWYLSQHPDNPLGYTVLVGSFLLGVIFAAVPLMNVWAYRRKLRGMIEFIRGSVEADGIRLAGTSVAGATLSEQACIPWSSLSLALLNNSNAVLSRQLDDQTQLLIVSSAMFKEVADWQLFHDELARTYQVPQRPIPTIRQQVFHGILQAIIIVAVFAILLAVGVTLRRR